MWVIRANLDNPTPTGYVPGPGTSVGVPLRRVRVPYASEHFPRFYSGGSHLTGPMLIEFNLAEGLRSLRGGDRPAPAVRFPSAEAASAYRVVRSHLRREGLHLTHREARAEFARRWPHLPWGEMGYWAMVKNAAGLLRG